MHTGTDKMIARKDGAIGWMIFNSPARRNAVSVDMWAAMPAILGAFEADNEIRAIVLAGAGENAFIAGADISEFDQKRGSAEAVKEYEAISASAHRALVGATKPTIAMIRGVCVGGGVAVALGCDLRIAADDGRFAVPAAKLGLGYGYGGIKRLIDVVGPAFAMEIFYTARLFDAAEALHMGLVNRVVPAAELESYVRNYAATIAANAPLTMAAVKQAVGEALKDESRRDLQSVQKAVDACFASDDYKEGRRAFMDKRKPKFNGR